MSTIIAERLELVKDIPLTPGCHTPPPKNAAPCGMCFMEWYAFVTGQAWTDNPDNCCSTISAFLRRYQDGIDQAGRDDLHQWGFDNIDRLARTANDGHREQRGYLGADFAIRTGLPVWLDLAGASEAAARVRALPPITDQSTARSSRNIVREIRKDLPDWWTWRTELRAKVHAAVEKALKDKKAAVDAAAAADAGAAAAADAAADAAAAAAAAADVAVDAAAAAAADAAVDAGADVAAAAGAAVAAAADVAVAAAADVAAAAGAEGAVYNKVYEAVREKVQVALTAKWEPAITPLKAGALELLERMVALGESKP